MKHLSLINAILDAAAAELKFLKGPLVESEFARQRAGGDPLTPPALPALARSPDRARIRTRVEWSAATQLTVIRIVTDALADALTERVTTQVRDALIAEKIADGSAQREFDAFKAEAERIPAAHAAARAKIARLKDVDQCQEVAKARMAVQGLISNLRAQRERRSARGRAA